MLNTWIGTAKKAARFSHMMWTQYRNEMDQEATTNNAVESFNRSWNLAIGRKPTIWKVIRHFKAEHHHATKRANEVKEAMLNQTQAGNGSITST